MTALLTLRNLFWLVSTGAEVILLWQLLRRKLQTSHQAFFIYILGAFAQSCLAAFIYIHWGYDTALASNVIWASQGVVICLRFAAVFEIASRVLSDYQGLRSFANRLLGAIGLCALAYSLVVAKKHLAVLVLSLDRGLELAMAAFIVFLLLFARNYMLPVRALDRALAIGFALYSCVYVVNDSMFEKLRNSYLGFWGYLDVLTFLASLLIWIAAVWTHSEEAVVIGGATKIPRNVYSSISPELNMRLKHLNKQLLQLLRAEKQNS